MFKPKNEDEEMKFWTEKVGVVSPHNAQGRLIIQNLFELLTNTTTMSLLDRKLPKTKLKQGFLMELLKNSIYSVEKFQGSDREVIIASVGLSDQDQLAAEEEFIYDVNRFNVLTSRAKKKLIVVCSENFLEYMPEDREILQFSGKMRKYCYDFCNREEPIVFQNPEGIQELLVFRWFESSKTKEE